MGNNNYGKAFAIAGFVCAIVGLVIGFFGTYFSIVSLPLSVTGLVLSVIGRKKCAEEGLPTGMATAGFVIGIIATVFSTIFFFTCGICTLCVVNEYENAIEEAYGYYSF